MSEMKILSSYVEIKKRLYLAYESGGVPANNGSSA